MRRAILLTLGLALLTSATIDDSYRRWQLRTSDDSEEGRVEKHRPLREQIDEAFDKWDDYKDKYGKDYSEEEETNYMEAFIKSVIYIDKHNKQARQGKKSFEMGLNHLADLPLIEYRKLNGFRRLYGDNNYKANRTLFMVPMNVQVPDQFDWREKDFVTPVKNQGMCGSCWAFSATGALEGQHKRKTGDLVSLSEQNLVDCSAKFGNHGCNGGLMDFAFEYVRQNHGIDTEESYPYNGRDGRCHFNKRTIGADDIGYIDLPEANEEALKIAVATQGPISVAIDAGHRSFQLYKKGVYFDRECSAEELDHGVLVVGYGTDPVGGDYWIIKNSWGESWGENGYIRIARNRDNHCGVASKASYPVV